MKKYVAKKLWFFSERTGIGLGKYAPKIFGIMIGSKPRKILTKNNIVK